MKKTLSYFNPIARLGVQKYSFFFPLISTLLCCFVSELYAYKIAHDPMAVGVYAIFLFVALIIYFAFRDGIRGGFIATAITTSYYFYIIYTRHYVGQQLNSGIETTIILTVLYLLIAGIIGGLKQKIDALIEREADEKRRLQAIVQQLPVGVLITDSKGKVTQANKKIESILGVHVPIGYIVGKRALVKSEHNGKLADPSKSPLLQTLLNGKPVIGKEYTINRSDGKLRYIQVTASAIHNKEGKIIAAAQIVNDITEQKELEERKDDFVNMASHELKTPITSMKLYIDSLMNRIHKTGDDKTIKILGSIKNQTQKLQDLVNDLLDVSRLQTGKLSFDKEEFRLDELVEETIEDLQATTKKQNILFVQKTPIIVYGDKFRLYQVITNLITNAIKYSPPGTAIDIHMYKEDKKAVVSVKDFGIGIEKNQQKKIFDRLYQVTDSKEKTFPGFGMGLYISKEIILRHKGHIWVESEKGKGATFYFDLPITS